jgi:hypothetical protein
VDTVLGRSEQAIMSQGMTEVVFFYNAIDYSNFLYMVNLLACGYSEYLGAVELGRYISDSCFLFLVS